MSVAVADLGYRYPGGAAALAGVSLEVARGELVAVIGASGCGKTTLLKLIAGFLAPDAGRIAIGGRDAASLPPRRRDLGVVFQTYALFPHMTVAENVAYGLRLRGMAAAERRQRTLAMLETVGLSAMADRRPATLSGGQQQRVALARALVFAPTALLLDEPLSALDAALRVEMRDEIRRLQQAHGIATLHVTHDQEEALSIADRVAVMAAGRLIQVASPRALYDEPADARVAAFVGHANLWPGTVTEGGVRVAFGELRCARAGHAPGGAVTVMARPEAFATGGDGPNAFPARLLRDRFLGAIRRCDLEIAGTTVLVETSRRGTIDAVSLPPEAIRLLPPSSP